LRAQHLRIGPRAGIKAISIAFVWAIGASSLAAAPGGCYATSDESQARQEYVERLTIARNAYFRVITSNDRNADQQAHEALTALEKAYPGDPIAKAYHGSLQLLDAAHNWAIWNLHRQAADGLNMLDQAVAQAPDEPEARFIRAATSWHLPGFYHRKAQYEADFAVLAPRAEQDARNGKLPPELAAATLNYWGQILVNRNDNAGAKDAFRTAVRIAPQSPGAADAAKRLRQIP
jgi:predicted negative regulator of RcsB-dependent stress response